MMSACKPRPTTDMTSQNFFNFFLKAVILLVFFLRTGGFGLRKLISFTVCQCLNNMVLITLGEQGDSPC